MLLFFSGDNCLLIFFTCVLGCLVAWDAQSAKMPKVHRTQLKNLRFLHDADASLNKCETCTRTVGLKI